MNRRTLATLVIIAVAIVVAVFRDFLFVNLNYQLDFAEHTRPASYAHSRFQAWVSGWDASQLGALKWSLAFLFILLNLVLAIVLARVRFGDHRYRMAISAGFILLGCVALSAHALSRYISGLDMLSIKLLHALQYPVVLLLIWAASWLPRR